MRDSLDTRDQNATIYRMCARVCVCVCTCDVVTIGYILKNVMLCRYAAKWKYGTENWFPVMAVLWFQFIVRALLKDLE